MRDRFKNMDMWKRTHRDDNSSAVITKEPEEDIATESLRGVGARLFTNALAVRGRISMYSRCIVYILFGNRANEPTKKDYISH